MGSRSRPRGGGRWRGALILLSIFMVCGLATPALAQKGKYVLGIGDRLSFLLYAGGESQLESKGPIMLTISEEGTVTLPFLGKVQADGLTVDLLTQEITAGLAADYFVDPQVILSVVDYRSKRVYILGEVKSPGSYGMERENPTLIELISMAGGATERRGKKAFVLRGAYDHVAAGGEIDELVEKRDPMAVDLQRLLERGDLTANVRLEPDDVVYIPPRAFVDIAQSKIYVMGHVKNPGVYEFQDGITALNACLLAGGFAKFAAANRATVTRDNGEKKTVIKIDLNDVKHGKADDMVLKPGDRVYVPKSWL
ncbi:MAG: polysaccharide biosynthesis/export family protein [Thermodesulfobacteriota bacterium]|nr:polysaccharide biosynthesis/export family protein [Thermodesulfobacteriota bacterium]